MKPARIKRLREQAEIIIAERQSGAVYELARGVVDLLDEREQAAREVGSLVDEMCRATAPRPPVIRVETLPSPITPGAIAHTLTQLDAGSSRFGPCEICEKPVGTMFLQVAHRATETPRQGLRWNAGLEVFGHENCLRALRAKP